MPESQVIDMADLPEKKMLNVPEASDYFGVEERTLRTWIKKGLLKAEKLAGSVRISREAIKEFRLKGQEKLGKAA
jgi:excisionase family DNA binding protein